jgi:3-oxoacyl-[acyl-carrier protein] reductase
MRLTDKVSIITGAGQGIGRATALKFSSEGAKVAVCDINQAAVDDTVRAILDDGGEAAGFKVDVTDKESIARMVSGVMGKWGRIDTLINNAGIVQDAQFKKMTDEQFERVIDVNLKGVYNCTKAVVDIMLEQNSGVILNASSIVGLYGNFGQTNYAATKFGVIGMVKTWATSLRSTSASWGGWASRKRSPTPMRGSRRTYRRTSTAPSSRCRGDARSDQRATIRRSRPS